MEKRILIGLSGFIFVSMVVLCCRFYPSQQVSSCSISRIEVVTPELEKYHNDCLHPCIRYSENGFAGYHYWMVQSPYYGWNNRVENPILYRSNNLEFIGCERGGVKIVDTPIRGYNSDPNLYIDDDSTLYIFWRECNTPLCDSIGHSPITVGVASKDGITFSEKRIYLINQWKDGDTEQAPMLIKHNGEYLFYATWYEYEPERKNKGIAIWRSSSLSAPNFMLTDTIPLESLYIPDKLAEVRISGYRLYCPKPQRFDMWHFDLWEKGDVIMVGESKDWKYFKMKRKPLVMNHYMENFVGYRQYYYKPTVCVDNKGTHYFWTSASIEDSNRNVLWSSTKNLSTNLTFPN